MPFTMDSAAEAYAAVSLLVVGADGVGTLEERQFLFGELGDADVFDGYDPESLGALMGTLVGRMHAAMPEGGAWMNPDAVGEICANVRSVLDDEQCRELFTLAVAIAHSDGLDAREQTMLTGIADDLGVDAETARTMIEGGIH